MGGPREWVEHLKHLNERRAFVLEKYRQMVGFLALALECLDEINRERSGFGIENFDLYKLKDEVVHKIGLIERDVERTRGEIADREKQMKEKTCGFKITMRVDEHGLEHKTFECELPHDHAGRYGRIPIIEHRQRLIQWMEHVLSKGEMEGLAALRSMSDRSGIPGLSPDLVDGNVMLEKLRSYRYATLESGMWRITDLGREVLRMRFDR
jgi:hypothetical protein